MNAVPMIVACHRRQWAADYDGPFIPSATEAELAPVLSRSTEILRATPLYTTHCQRCGCDHGPGAPPIAFGEAAA